MNEHLHMACKYYSFSTIFWYVYLQDPKTFTVTISLPKTSAPPPPEENKVCIWKGLKNENRVTLGIMVFHLIKIFYIVGQTVCCRFQDTGVGQAGPFSGAHPKKTFCWSGEDESHPRMLRQRVQLDKSIILWSSNQRKNYMFVQKSCEAIKCEHWK